MPSAPARLNASSASSAHCSLVEPAIAAGRLQHRVLAAHLISEGRHPELVLHPPDDVEVGHAGFDHHHVGAFLEIERDFMRTASSPLAGSTWYVNLFLD
jgi:hypothetical protein